MSRYFVLRAVAEIVAASHPLDETLNLVLKVVAEAIGADRGLALVLDRKSSALVPVAEFRFRDALHPALAVPVGYGLLGRAATGAAAKAFDLSPTDPMELAPGLTVKLRVYIAQPLRTSEEVLGVILLAKANRASPFTEAAEDLIQACASLLAVAVKRDELLRDSQLDETTGVYNFRALTGSMEAELARAGRDNRPFSVLFLELDDFGALNNEYGHLVGNMALKLLAETLKGTTRKRSSIRMPDLVARMGGDEFVVILPATDKETARVVAERIRAAVQALKFPGTHTVPAHQAVPLTVSIGVATYPDDGNTIKELLDRSDRAMYEAKAMGKNQVHLFTPELLAQQVTYRKTHTIFVDHLTGLWHERSFRPALDRSVRAASTYGESLSLALVDLDRFQKLNDVAGHDAANEVIRGVAGALQALVGEKGQVYRLTGDEFGLILPSFTIEQAAEMAESIRREIAARNWPVAGREPLRVTLTAGVASLPKDTVSAEELVMKADLALHQGKQRGGNRVEV